MGPGNRIASALTGEDFNIGQKVNEHLAQLEQMKQRGMQAYGDEGFDVAGLVTELASPPYTKAAQIISRAPTYGKKVLQGMGMGGGAAATVPVTEGDFEEEKEEQLETGIAAGAAIPGLGVPIFKAGKIAYHLAEPAFNAAAVKGRALLATVGDKADDIIALLKQKKEIVPGSRPTAGQAAAPAGSAEFSSLQKQAEQVIPSEYVARSDAQNAARLAQVRRVGKTPTRLDKVRSQRARKATKLYGAAGNVTVRTDDIWTNLTGRSSIKKAISRAKEIASDEGVDFIEGEGIQEIPVHQFHKVKMALDDLTTNPDRFGIGAKEVDVIRNLQKVFLNWLENKAPAYKIARTTYAKHSKVINQMEVGQELERRLIPALSEEGKQRAAMYAQALQDAPRTVKRATGQSRYSKLKEVLTPKAKEAVESVKLDLEREGRYEYLASKGREAAPEIKTIAGQAMTEEISGKPPTVLLRVMMVMNHILRRAQGHLSGEMAKELALEMLYPEKIVQTLAQARFRQTQMERSPSNCRNTL